MATNVEKKKKTFENNAILSCYRSRKLMFQFKVCKLQNAQQFICFSTIGTGEWKRMNLSQEVYHHFFSFCFCFFLLLFFFFFFLASFRRSFCSPSCSRHVCIRFVMLSTFFFCSVVHFILRYAVSLFLACGKWLCAFDSHVCMCCPVTLL